MDPISAILAGAGMTWFLGSSNRCRQCNRPTKESRYFIYSEEGAELPGGCYNSGSIATVT